MSSGFSLKNYLDQVASFLRRKEAEMSRGDLERLQDLETVPDGHLLRKWSWISSLVGVGVAFFAMPILASLLQSLLPHWLSDLIWAVAKVSMGLTFLMFIAAVYFTISESQD